MGLIGGSRMNKPRRTLYVKRLERRVTDCRRRGRGLPTNSPGNRSAMRLIKILEELHERHGKKF